MKQFKPGDKVKLVKKCDCVNGKRLILNPLGDFVECNCNKCNPRKTPKKEKKTVTQKAWAVWDCLAKDFYSNDWYIDKKAAQLEVKECIKVYSADFKLKELTITYQI